jgi:hypothetical protein
MSALPTGLRRVIITCLTAVVLSCVTATPALAISDPQSVSNNKFGIHVADTNDLTEAAKLVNGNGGDWGYVTFVIQDDDRNVGKWQEIFNQARRFRVIPIIRIATHVHGDAWVVPDTGQVNAWGDFLNALVWPVKNRYVVLFNEPNHSKEWGGNIDPEGYADTFMAFRDGLKHRSDEFFVLPAGLDTAASSDGEALDADDYLTRMVRHNPGILSGFDGWTSHSYPNPGFAASPYGSGKGSIRSFQWELSRLHDLGLSRQLPVFITETGWMHREGKYFSANLPSAAQVGDYLKIAADTVWKDPSVVAVTPFLLNYQDYPFDHFSMRKLQSSEYYESYGAYLDIPKTRGTPDQRENVPFVGDAILPEKLVNDSVYELEATIKNDGQSIIDPTQGYTLSVAETSGLFTIVADAVPYLEPGMTGKIRLSVRSPKVQGSYPVTVSLIHGQKTILPQTRRIFIIPPPSVGVSLHLGWRKSGQFTGGKLLVYDMGDNLIHVYTGLSSKTGSVRVEDLSRVIPGKMYRLVFVLPPYLPRQELVSLKPDHTDISFKRLVPLDFSRDGALGIGDIAALLATPPVTVWSYLF